MTRGRRLLRLAALAVVWVTVGCTASGSSDSTRPEDEVSGLDPQAVIELWGDPDAIWYQDGKLIVDGASSDIFDASELATRRYALDYRDRQVRLWLDAGVVTRVRPLDSGEVGPPPSVQWSSPPD